MAAAGAELRVTGITEPRRDVTLSARVAGTIQKLHFEEGDPVGSGHVIVELDKELEQLAVERRRLVQQNLETELKSIRLLYNTTKSESREVLLKKEMEYNVARVDLKLAEEQLRRREIVSPIDGYIAELMLQEGEDCQAQQPVVRVVDTRQCYLVCHLDADDGRRLSLDQEIPLEISLGTETVRFTGRISFISPVVDPASGLLKVKILFENQAGRIRPGIAGQALLLSPRP